ncbi:ArsR/SmtB family transcription factor [Streptomyces profundus]|uniref:ArsR/SmtB family transcription factor n=1 Tax=Streptomyces profundus TaxID=2867410 RepID=UPI001D168D3D|nr:metalloregulator ArsR/SmtB family transcription factor [Streptomyces sp. MA3_2.13]UED86423.1 metalloregulator ArsR/SmtB family transcription factor [Streptomyces sp. MA3_2.13]
MVSISEGGPGVVVDAAALARVGTALADESRRRLLLALLAEPAYPSDLADRLGMTRGNVSNHLSCLRGCGLVRGVPVGRRVRYELADPKLAHALAELAALVLLVDHQDASGEPCGPDDYAHADERPGHG